MSSLIQYALITSKDHLASKLNPESVERLKSIESLNSQSHYKVLVVDYEQLQGKLNFDFKNYCQRLVVVIPSSDTQIKLSYFNKSIPHLFIEENKLTEGVFLQQDQILQEEEQNLVYLNLASELNAEYENIKLELENKLSEAKLDLLESRQKILEANHHMEAMRKILYSLSHETDLFRVETLLNELLPSSSAATWVKIIPNSQQTEFEDDLVTNLKLSFKSYHLSPHYLVYFIKGDSKPFKKNDLNLFNKINDIIKINYSRELNFKKLNRTEAIVSKAFSEFKHPLAVIDMDYNVLRSNNEFNQNKKGHKCYEIFFKKNKPCTNCQLGSRFHVEQDKNIFEIQSHSIHSDQWNKKVWINLYRNRTEEYHFEQRLNQTAKIKELGIISSSIAHELNNPIGGVLSYLQILEMELPANSPLKSDIKQMIETTLRMKTTIENLLIFSRVPNLSEKNEYSISDLLTESLKIHELQLKSENIKLVTHPIDQKYKVNTSKSVFRDSLHFIINFYIERIKAYRKISAQQTGLVEVNFSADLSQSAYYELEFKGNCGKLEENEKSKDISLLALSKCLTDQNMHYEIDPTQAGWIGIKILIRKS